MKRSFLILLAVAAVTTFSCKKNRPSEIIAGTYTGHFEGTYMGNDTIVNTGYQVTVSAKDKNKANVTSSFTGTFSVLVTKNGINVELVSPTEGLNEFLYEGETRTLSFIYVNDGDTASYVGSK